MIEEKVPFCRHCWIEAVPMPEAKRIIGRGESAGWKHKELFDEDGNPSCGTPLKEEDLVYAPRPTP